MPKTLILQAACLSLVLCCAGCGASSGSGSLGADPAGTTSLPVTTGSATTGAATTTAGAATAGAAATGSATTTGATPSGATTSSITTTDVGPTFDSSRAFTLLQSQCNLGPRPMGSAAHDQCLQWIVQQLTPLVDSAPMLQTFSYTSPTSGQKFNVTNIIGRINPTAKTQILLCGHWDTRPFADQDTTLANRSKPILGADDGASEVAVLLELAREFHSHRPTAGVELVFFDGEDYSPVVGNYDEMYLGSTYFASHLSGSGSGPSLKPTYGILLDMIGDQQLDIYEEKYSVAQAPQIVQKVWNAADALGYSTSFIPLPKYDVEDDHLPLLKQGIPVIDCIDFDYESFQDPTRQYWHTLMDTPDKCSPQSLQIVGNVMSKVVYDES